MFYGFFLTFPQNKQEVSLPFGKARQSIHRGTRIFFSAARRLNRRFFMLKRAFHYFTLSLVGFVVIGCNNLDTLDDTPVPAVFPTEAITFNSTFPVLDLANGVIPLPNDLLRDPATGNLTIPGEGEPFVAANTLDGFSTSGNIIIPFNGNVVADTVTNASLPVINTATGQPAPMSYSVVDGPTGSVVTATPVVALDSSTQYIVILTNQIVGADSSTPILSDGAINLLKGTDPLVDGNGNTTISVITNEQAAALEPARAAFQPIWAAAEGITGQGRAEIPLAFVFTTQTLQVVLPALREEIVATNNTTIVGANPAALIAGNPALANLPIAAGNPTSVPALGPTSLGPAAVPSVPYFVNAVIAGQVPGFELPADLQAALSQVPIDQIGRIHLVSYEAPIYREDNAQGFFDNPPVQVGTRTVPALVFLPLAAADPTTAPPVPVAIFQHGITGQKELGFTLANGFNGQTYGLIAIDLELHGAFTVPGGESGDGFINVLNLRNSRDNVRASVTNLYALTDAIVNGRTSFDDISAIDPALVDTPEPAFAPGTQTAPFASPVFIGHSLGAITGDVFHATEPNIARSVLNVGGSRISSLLLNSPAFSTPIIAGLSAAGLEQGTSDFDLFFLITQTIVDDVDPVNYAEAAITGSLRGGSPAEILQQANVSDLVVPPSSQIDLAIQHGQGASVPAFSQVDAIDTQALIAQISSPFVGSGVYEVPNATHGALLSPIDNAGQATNPTVQIVTQAINYLLTGGIIDTGIRARQAPVESGGDISRYERAVRF